MEKVNMLTVTITIRMKCLLMLTTMNLKEELAESHLLASEQRSACRRDW